VWKCDTLGPPRRAVLRLAAAPTVSVVHTTRRTTVIGDAGENCMSEHKKPSRCLCCTLPSLPPCRWGSADGPNPDKFLTPNNGAITFEPWIESFVRDLSCATGFCPTDVILSNAVVSEGGGRGKGLITLCRFAGVEAERRGEGGRVSGWRLENCHNTHHSQLHHAIHTL
jgi:hypothetical protein